MAADLMPKSGTSVALAASRAFQRRCAAVIVVVAIVSLCRPIAAQQKPATTPLEYASRAREVVAALAAGRFDEVFADFSPAHGPNLSPRSIGNGWEQVIRMSGQFQKIEAVQVADRQYHVATVTCIFDSAKRDVLIYFDNDGRIAGLQYAPPAASSSASAAETWTAPSYADPSTFHEVPVRIADGQWNLPGTLTLPNGTGPYAAVVLVSGSGANDADGTLGPNKVLKDLAWGFANKGIAVLRYPKRTHVYGAASSADPGTFTVKDEYLDDARAAVALLASRQDIDRKRIFVAGHSEGGFLAPRIASGDPSVAGIIILEGNTRSIAQAAVDQLRYLAGLPGPNAAAIRNMLPEVQAQAAAMTSPNLKPGTTLKLLNSTVPSSYVLDLRR